MVLAPAPRCFTRTEKSRCRVCYTCVRGCPAKAIRILDRQAEIVPERCVGCGNCVRVCSQDAKRAVDTTAELEALLAGPLPVAALVAPSFVAELHELEDHGVLVGMLRALGFARVVEVGFGADLVAEAYRRLLDERRPGRRYIASTCPAVVGFVERYWPELVENLAPVVSPMVATARALRELAAPEVLRMAFIGPCIAKKVEASLDELAGEIDVVVTFSELRRLLQARGIGAAGVAASDFDPPHAGTGALFPINRGLLQAAQIVEDLSSGEVVSPDGGVRTFVEAIKEFANRDLDAGLLELLSCDGCIAGPGMTSSERPFRRRARVASYVRRVVGTRDHDAWVAAMERLRDLDLSRSFTARDQRTAEPSPDDVEAILRRLGKQGPADELNCGACGYETCRRHAVAILRGLAQGEMCLPHLIDRLDLTVRELSEVNEQRRARFELIRVMAHELKAPLAAVEGHLVNLRDGVVREPADVQHVVDRSLVRAHGMRQLILDLLDMTRIEAGLRERAMVGLELRELARLCLDAFSTQAAARGIALVVADGPRVDLVAERTEMEMVLNNLVSNAIKYNREQGRVVVQVERAGEQVRIAVSDTGIGIAPADRAKLFRDFSRIKNARTRGIEGSGLGLATVKKIAALYDGDVSVDSEPERGSTFTVTLRAAEPARDGQVDHRQSSVQAWPGAETPSAGQVDHRQSSVQAWPGADTLSPSERETSK